MGANQLSSQLYDLYREGTVLRIGHPANNLVWIKTGHGWINNLGRRVTREDAFDTLEHGAFDLLAGGL